MSAGARVGTLSSVCDDHFVGLAGASLVGTRLLCYTRDRLREVLRAQAMACVHGDAGLGKTLAVNAALRALAPHDTVRIQFRSRPSPRDIRHELFRALDIPGAPPTRPVEFDAALKAALSTRFRVLVCDEAQQLSRECFEYWRYLWDDRGTKISIVFVGGGDCYQVLKREPMLSSRIYSWLAFHRMQRDEVHEVIPKFHPLWAQADEELIDFVDSNSAHGNFRNWALVTAKTLDGLALQENPKLNQDLVQWTFATLDGGK